ncbi:MAG: transglycosylase domain-containing protein [Bacteroidetes bacterium]|nr:transglycosylase domain-containing protein [Bacteroidota bacterium]
MAKTSKKTSKAGSKKDYSRHKLAVWVIGLGPLIGLGSLVLMASFGQLPNTEALANPKTDLATRVFSSDGKLIGRYYSENRASARFDELPQNLIAALISTEDVRFESHSGIDFIGLARAIAFMGKRGGGSTLTQQLAKQLFTEEYEQTSWLERAFLQKPQEWIIATRLERYYTKDEIIALYLNRYDFLNQAVGIKSAANIYFDKDVNELDWHESAMLVGMLKNSSLYNPVRRPELVLSRRNVVIGQLERYGKITAAEADSIAALDLGLRFQKVSHDEGLAPYFREALRLELKKILEAKDEQGNYLLAKSDGSPYDLYRDGIQVYTTLDSRLQQAAENAVHEHLSRELQAALNKDLERRKESEWPFYRRIKAKDRDQIIQTAMEQSDRYLVYTGKKCPECLRPGFYITKAKGEQGDMWHCDETEGGCSHQWPRFNEEQIAAAFDQPVQMRIFKHEGYKDTIMSPRDSILYHKSILHAGLMSIEPRTGHIKAWVGGVDYRYFKFDNVSQSKRQVGSVFKPFVYATALRNGYSRCTEVPNQRICIEMPGGQPDWCPDNANFSYGEVVTLEYALANSMNTISAKLIKDFGPERIIEVAHALGIESDIPAVPSIALGSSQLTLKEMTSANASIVNGGVYIKPTMITRIENKYGNVIWSPIPEMRQGLDEKTAYTILNMMKGVINGARNPSTGQSGGTAVRLRYDSKSRDYDNITVPMAGKTGTTQNHSDGWFMGLTPDLVTGVWVGAQDPAVRFTSISDGQGANTALPIYGYYMNQVYANPSIEISKSDFERPEGIFVDLTDCKQLLNSNPIGTGAGIDEDLFE